MKRSDFEGRFFSYVDKTDTCWIWRGSIQTRGYGQIVLDKKRVYAHRWIYTHIFGEISEGLYVCHKCDNPPCVNPDHLFLGTQTENMADMIKKGRQRKRRKKIFYTPAFRRVKNKCRRGHDLPAVRLRSYRCPICKGTYRNP